MAAAVISAAALAAGTYLDARFGMSIDLKLLRNEREWGVRLGERMKELGDNCTMYAIFDRVDPGLDALWFEGRTWTYGEVKVGMSLVSRDA